MGEQPVTTGTIEVEGCRLSWQSLGEGPPLLLVNGYAATAADWDPTFLAELAKSFSVICPDNRGMGGSDLGLDEVTVGRMASDCMVLLDELEVESVALAGWSMGGYIAQELAGRHPDRVERLALLSTDPGGPASVAMDPDAMARLFDHTGSPREQASRLIGLLFPPAVAEQIDADFGEVVAEARAALSTQALNAQEAAMKRWAEEPAGERMAAIAAPTLVMAGEEDSVIAAANSSILAESLPGARLELFPRTGHAFMAQEPLQAAALIGEHCAD